MRPGRSAMADLSHFERRALAAVAAGMPIRSSAVGFILWEACDPATRKPNPSPQGMALFAGGFLGPLAKRGLIRPVKEGWAITPDGRVLHDPKKAV